MAELQIPAHEIGVTRVFSMSMDGSTAKKLRDDPGAMAAALGVETVRPEAVEVFALSDLGDLGLLGYLRDGIDAKEADLKRDSVKLAALDGWVMLLHSSAFEGKATDLTPVPELTLVGTYSQAMPDTAPIVLDAEAAQPYSGTSHTSKPVAQQTKARGSLVSVLIFAIIAFILWWSLA